METNNKKLSLGWWIGKIFIAFLALTLVFLGFAYVNGRTAAAQDLKDYPPPGEMVDIGTHNLHLYCLGEGSPTVILEAGASSWSVVWSLVQEEIAQSTRVCAYDRAGLGWSEPGPQPRTAGRLVDELHTLLETAGIEGPYVLVGHSYGGSLVRLYAGLHPDQVAGLVMVDATHPDMPARLSANLSSGLDQFKAIGTLAQLGILRMLPSDQVPTWTLPEDVLSAYFSIMARPNYYQASVSEIEQIESSLLEIGKVGDLGDIPLIVLTAGDLAEEFALQPDVDQAEYRAIRLELHQELADLSSNGQLIVAEESGHIIQLYQPQLVIEAVSQVMAIHQGD